MESRKKTYYETLTGEVKVRYDEKIRNCGGIDPYIIKMNDLSLNPKDLPKISADDIENYMVHCVSPFTKRFYNNYKGTEAHSFFESGFVLSLGSKKNETAAIVKGKVKHSQRMNETPLNVWILANMNGEIICAHCTCIAGLSETCSHVGAICFAVENIVQSTEAIKSVTDILCKWNIPKSRGVSMSPATEINWKIPSYEPTTLETSFLTYCDSLSHLTDDKIDQFISKCHDDGDETALETILYPSEVRRKTSIRDEIFLATLYSQKNRNKTLSELVEIGKSKFLNISDAEAEEICRMTLPRLKSKCCLALRRGRITGSNFKNCCDSSSKDPSITTIRRVINFTTVFGDTPSIKYKKKAIESYIRKVKLNHENALYKECGLMINQKLPYFAGSPDGLVSCNCHGDGCMKTQYLKSLMCDASVEAMTLKPNNVLNKHGHQYTLEETHEFFYQAQLQINLIGLEYCDFIIWSPQKAISVRVSSNIDFWNVAIEKASKFHELVIMPELLGKFYTDKGTASSIEQEEDDGQLIELEIEFLD